MYYVLKDESKFFSRAQYRKFKVTNEFVYTFSFLVNYWVWNITLCQVKVFQLESKIIKKDSAGGFLHSLKL